MKKIGFALVIGLSLLVCAYAFAQGEAPTDEVTALNLGLIKGKVTDTEIPRPNGIPDAIVTVENDMLLGADARIATTDQAGNYEVSNLPPGEYLVTVSKPGFHTVTTSKPGSNDSYGYVTVTPGGEAFHDVRLHRTHTLINLSRRLGVFYGVLLLCAIIVAIYIINRRSSNKAQNR